MTPRSRCPHCNGSGAVSSGSGASFTSMACSVCTPDHLIPKKPKPQQPAGPGTRGTGGKARPGLIVGIAVAAGAYWVMINMTELEPNGVTAAISFVIGGIAGYFWKVALGLAGVAAILFFLSQQ